MRSEGVNLVQLWDASSGQLLREVREADVEQAAVSKDSGRIVGKRRNAQGWRVESWPVEQAAAGPSVLHETLAGDFAFLDLSRHGDYYPFIPRGSTAFDYTSLAVWGLERRTAKCLSISTSRVMRWRVSSPHS